ncbi:hypothetical protein TNIN_83771 [Trichonephila inaurata madagascariensis]|uniref:Uncharacterized protein n=1 Tax=Trichonephila inaurata madagascariensis TaxID=2747483 RepID=A0A8X6XWG5_9ARAC|nr:hypothetical protein TNIN_83771 [Trichonephila inaurata madagascariensis]
MGNGLGKTVPARNFVVIILKVLTRHFLPEIKLANPTVIILSHEQMTKWTPESFHAKPNKVYPETNKNSHVKLLKPGDEI